ncbi:hypothetical protein BJX68DRAFT_269065 [Aspergillus pseudodeflectus]|uniref:Fungal-specific transcription factor domain-containing protein n=1 Tax=Aspergillus pseudodeflectus TaxID=176178 RepID=A0ABR4JZS1_9EURO
MESEKVGSRSLTFIHGPTIRGGASNASLIRSQLMRQRRWEKQGQLRGDPKSVIKSVQGGKGSGPSLPVCRCGRNISMTAPSTTLPGVPPSQPTHQTLPVLQPKRDSSQLGLIPVMCPRCSGLRTEEPPFTIVHTREIASSQVDPFFSDRSKASSNFDLLLHHCVYVLWPMARPTDIAERSLQAYLHPSRSSMVMQSLLYSASLHRDALPRIRGATEGVSSTAQQLRLKGSVMNQIREKLSTVNSANIHENWIDDILMSILYLAANENIDQIGQPERSPFIPPFRSLQLMEFYGSCEFHPLHWQTVRHIVLERGGLTTVKLHGLAWLIAISGLIVAVNTNCKPVFPLISPEGKLSVYRAPLLALSIRMPPRHTTLCNHGFQQLALLSPPIKGNIIRVFLDLSEISQALNALAGQPCGSRLLTQIGDVRASVLHRLCSLPDQSDRPSAILHKRQCTAEEQKTSIAIYLICRRTALLYAANVVLPLPKTSQLRHEMTVGIYEDMKRLERREQTDVPEILLWCSVIAGICSDATPTIRAWFVAEARRHCETLGIGVWSEFLELMQSFSWLDSASDEAGTAFWDEIRLTRG